MAARPRSGRLYRLKSRRLESREGVPGISGTQALVVVDVQNDFCEGGALGVDGGNEVAARVAKLAGDPSYDRTAATKDWHIEPGAHFSSHPDFVRSWPVHCRANTPGAAFNAALKSTGFGAVFLKGQYSDGYSGFDGVAGDETGNGSGPRLADWLSGMDAVDVVGLATDHCVRATALDAVRHGFTTRVLLDYCAGVAHETIAAALDELRRAGVELIG